MDTLRISLDTKAKVKVGAFSRGGRSRGRCAVQALDHDMAPQAVLVPLGILEIQRGPVLIDQPWLLFGHSRETADFIADGLSQWWTERRTVHQGVRRLQIELDNGPEIASSRTQFMKRMVNLADDSGLEIELVYLPPYHSKYNPIERFWGILEQHWNGVLLNTTDTVLRWAETVTWRNVSPIVRETTATYECGIKLTRSQLRPISDRLIRSETIRKWSLTITPA